MKSKPSFAPRPLSSIASYCVVFLWHAGEKLRAVALTYELTRCDTLKEAKAIVENLVSNYGQTLRARNRVHREFASKLNKENPCNPPV